VDFSSLADKVALIGIRALINEHSVFDDKLIRDFYRLKIQSIKAIPSHCYAKLVNEASGDFRFVIQGDLLNQHRPKVSAASDYRPAYLQGMYRPMVYLAKEEYCGDLRGVELSSFIDKNCKTHSCDWNNPTVANEYTQITQNFYDCFYDEKNNNNEETDKKIKNFKPGDLKAKLAKQYPDTQVDNLRDIELMQIYHELLHSDSENKLVAKMKLLKNKITKEEALDLVALFGYQFNEGYDSDRAAASPALNDSSVVGTGDLLGAAQANADSKGVKSYAGVCRDIAVAQARMLRAFGFNKTYVVVYNTVQQVPHTSVMAVDPDNPNQIYKINYSKRMDSKGGSSLSMHQGNQDAGFGYYLYDANKATPIIYLPGITSEVMAEFAGGGLEEIGGDPLSRPKHHKVSAAYRFGKNKDHGLSLGVAQDGIGNRYVVSGYNLKFGNRDYSPGKIGVSVGVQNRPGEVHGYPDGQDRNMGIGYVLYSQKFRTPAISPIGDSQALWVDTNISAALALAGTFEEYTAGLGSVDAHIKPGLNFEQRLGDRSTLRFRVESQHTPMTKDVRNATSEPENVTMSTDFIAFQTEGNIKLPFDEKIYLISRLDLVRSHLGYRGRAELGVASDLGAVTVYGQGPLTRDTETFQEAGGREIAGRIVLPFEYMGTKINLSMSPYYRFEERGRNGYPENWEGTYDEGNFSHGAPGDSEDRKDSYGSYMNLEVEF